MRTRIRDLVTSARGLPAMTLASLTLYGGGFALLSLAVVTWVPGKNPRWVFGVLAVLALAIFLYVVRRSSRLTQREATAMVSVLFATVACLSWTTSLDLGALANGTTLPIVGIYVVWFLHPVWGRVVLYAGLVGWFVAILHHDDRSLAGFAVNLVIQSVIAAEVFAALKTRMDHLATTDSLTGTLTRGGVRDVIERELVRAGRTGTPLSIVAVDLDGLREVNNDQGHRAGDELLEAVAQHWVARLRRGDTIGRVGGDEFLFVLPGTTMAVAEEIVARLAEGTPGSWSAGVAVVKPGDTITSLIERADQRLYVDKSSRQS